MGQHFVEKQAKDEIALGDQALITTFRLLAPQTMVTLLRLNLFVRIVQKGSVELKCLVFAARMATNSWLHAVEKDLAWMSLLMPDLALRTTEQWIQAIAATPELFKREFKIAALGSGAGPLSVRIGMVMEAVRYAHWGQERGRLMWALVSSWKPLVVYIRVRS